MFKSLEEAEAAVGQMSPELREKMAPILENLKQFSSKMASHEKDEAERHRIYEEFRKNLGLFFDAQISLNEINQMNVGLSVGAALGLVEAGKKLPEIAKTAKKIVRREKDGRLAARKPENELQI